MTNTSEITVADSYTSTPTHELRFNTYRRRTNPILEQAFNCFNGERYWVEWKRVLFCEIKHENNANLPKDW